MKIKESFLISIILHSVLLILILSPIITIKSNTSILNVELISENSETKDVFQDTEKRSSKIIKNDLKLSSKKFLRTSIDDSVEKDYGLKNVQNKSAEINKDNFYTKPEKKNNFQSLSTDNLRKRKIVKAKYKIGSIDNPHPPYPLLARREGMEGKLILEVLVKPDGLVEKINLIKSSGHELLDKVSKDTIEKWYFTPARLGDKYIKDIVAIPVRFVLSEP